MSKLSRTALLMLVYALLNVAPSVAQQDTTTIIPNGNVWLIDAQGKHFTCPISGETAVVTDKTLSADWNGKRWYFCCPGCDQKFLADPAASVAKMIIPANVIAAKGDAIMVTCPVTGDKIAVNKNTKYQDYNGQRYYFCCDKCPPKFAKSPEKYVKKTGDSPTGMKDMPMDKKEEHPEHGDHH